MRRQLKRVILKAMNHVSTGINSQKGYGSNVITKCVKLMNSTY
jgi:hypothetical protein